MKVAFWLCASLVLACYLLYPAVLFLAYCFAQIRRDLQYLHDRENRRAPVLSDEDLPDVTIVVAAYNEMERLPDKIANIEEIDYPADKLHFVFVSDGSSDGTAEFLGRITRPNFQAILNPERRGKAVALNHGVASAQTEVLVLSDASTLFTPQGIRRLVRHFGDEKVGVVCGSLEFRSIATTGGNEGVYWSAESMMRLMESRLGATLTASGAFYAIRKQCVPQLSSDTVLDDLMVPMHARSVGYKVAYDPEAVAIEFPASTIEGEYVRRVRIATGSFRALGTLLRTPMPGFTRIAFIGHKLLRWTVPFFLFGILVSNAFLLDSPLYRGFFAAQLLFYLWAAVGYSLRERASRLRFLLLGYFVVAMNFAFIVGLFRFMRSSQRITWERVN